MLRLAEIGVFELLWSDHLLVEVERVLVEYKGLSRDRASYFCDCIRTTFPDGRVAADSYERLINSRQGPDPDDHPHSAAAVAGGARVLLSADRRGFPSSDIEPAKRRHPDAYLTAILRRDRHLVLGIVDDMGSALSTPRTRRQVLDLLDRAGLVRFAAEAASR